MDSYVGWPPYSPERFKPQVYSYNFLQHNQTHCDDVTRLSNDVSKHKHGDATQKTPPCYSGTYPEGWRSSPDISSLTVTAPPVTVPAPKALSEWSVTYPKPSYLGNKRGAEMIQHDDAFGGWHRMYGDFYGYTERRL